MSIQIFLIGSLSAWQANTAYILGQQIIVGSISPTSDVWQVTTAGTSGSSMPTFTGTTIGVSTVSDNTVVWTYCGTLGTPIWIVPPNWTNSNTIECIGRGGAPYTNIGNAGAGGGAYSKISNLSLTVGAFISYQVGDPTNDVAISGGGFNGGNTWFNGTSLSSASVSAQGGQGTNGATGGSGGLSSLSLGTVKFSGGNGGNSTAGFTIPAGGGGAAGSHGNGAPGEDYNAGASGGDADAGHGGAGGISANPGNPGGNGTEWNSNYGSGGGGGANNTTINGLGGSGGLYGGGGGGTPNGAPSLHSGGQGIIVITYTGVAPIGTSGAIWVD